MDHPRVRKKRQELRPFALKTPCSAPTASRGSGPDARECRLCAYLRWSLRGEALRRAGLLPGPPPPGPRWRGAARVPCGVYARVQGAMGESGQGCRGARAGPGVRRDPGGNSLSFFTDLGALRVDRCGRPLRIRSEVEINPSIDKSPLYKGGRWGRSSELGSGRQRKVVLGRVLGTVLLRAGWMWGCSGNGGLRNWGPAQALGQRHGDVPVRDRCGSKPATPASLLQDRGRDSLGSFPILTSQDFGWKQGMGRLGESQKIMFSNGADGNPIKKRGRGFSLSP